VKVAIRADASVAIGTGHVMRCLTLADALRDRGAVVRFLCRRETGDLGKLITGKGYEVSWLPPDGGSETDAQASIEALEGDKPWDWLVVDHYGLDAEWERCLRRAANKIMVIDDLADRSHDCDLLLDQNLHESGCYAGLVPESCQILMGPKYALLRPQFATARQNLQKRDGRVSRLLLFFGGADAGGETLNALSAIQMLGRADLNVDVVIGETNPHRESIESACRSIPNTTLYCQVDDMATCMATADLFVGAGGTSSWERCCLGLPAVVVATATNQIEQCEALDHVGTQIYLGVASEVSTEHLMLTLDTLLNGPARVKIMSEMAHSLVDAQGTGKVIGQMLP
jgi:UDP-2,4-diacetamido-2,4,6-trideoxy-beta-L-altropyranose hydrolase